MLPVLRALVYRFLYLGSLFERDEIKDLLSLLSLVTDKRALGLIRAAALPGYAVRLEHISALGKRLRESDLPPLGWLAMLDELPELDEQARESLKRLASLVADFSYEYKTLASACEPGY